ncbi:MAG: hypothetical protein E6K92_10280 [Thaumarchaeota archaeon]|nr:MAG: hypothetical protein E6K92_10280 [Nitrososphaerota archaeon]
MEANPLADFMSSGMLLDMIIGMAMGMAASPLMMRGIKALRHRRKIGRLFQEIAQARNSADGDSLPAKSDIF